MKKVWAAILIVVALAGVGLGGLWLMNRDDASDTDVLVIEKFSLAEEMWGQGGFRDITAAEFGDLVAERKNFIVVLHMMICPAEFPVTSIAKQLAHDEGVVIYGLTEEEFRKTELAKEIKYLPSVAIYHDGELVAYLDAEADADLPYYQTVNGLKAWLGKYVDGF